MRLIDADKLYWKLKEKMEDEWNQRVAPASWADAYEAFMDEIYDQPTIDAEPVRRARWERRSHTIRHGNMTLTGTYPTCTACGYGMVGLDKETLFCPNCGAKMDGRTE